MKKFIRTLFMMVLTMSFIFALGISASAEDYSSRTFIDKDRNRVPVGEAVLLDDSKESLFGGRYVISGDLKLDKLEIYDDTEIILLDHSNAEISHGILVLYDYKLTIYSECLDSDKMGSLTVGAPYGEKAGIGPMNTSAYPNIIICGGIITANGASNSAGIGSCFQGNCKVDIYNGIINATGGSGGAGIGSGSYANCKVNIFNGTIVARGGKNATGIGSGNRASAYVYISDNASIDAEGGENADNINNQYNVPAGFTLSQGNWWIIGTGAVVILGGISAIIISKKKKKISE